jgi:S1-C subfamily serine protease
MARKILTAMRTPRRFRSFAIVLPILFLTGLVCAPIVGQTPAPAPQPRKTTAPTASPVVLQNKPPAPQVVTILHRLNGIKVFRLLVRNQEQFEAIVRLDQAFQLAGDVHTNVIAGLALDDGQTIAAWLPEAEAEMPPPAPFAVPRTPRAPRAPGTTPAPDTETPATNVAPMPPLPRMSAMDARELAESKFEKDFLESADLRIITRDGKRISGRYLGLDGLTGLSLITLTNGSVPLDAELKDEKVTVGQHLRVIGPQPAPGAESGARSPMYIRIGETEGLVVSVTRSPSGGISKIKVRSAKFTPANIGGVAISDNNETLGIVDAVEGADATIVPLNMVRLAAKRVSARQASVPRPWLGIRGEPIDERSLERIMRSGWEVERARALTEKGQGILLTQVAPGSPAALAKLKPGDVILTVNNGFVRNAEDFSSLLDEVDPENSVLFTVARPDKAVSEAMEIKLGESPDGFFPRRFVTPPYPKFMKPKGLLGEGIEAIALKPQVASRFGASAGLLVVSVQPETDAFKAGLRPGDVIESIDGQPVYSGTGVVILPKTPGAKSACIVVRNKEKITLKFEYSVHEHDSNQP